MFTKELIDYYLMLNINRADDKDIKSSILFAKVSIDKFSLFSNNIIVNGIHQPLFYKILGVTNKLWGLEIHYLEFIDSNIGLLLALNKDKSFQDISHPERNIATFII